jgi:3-deoxy-D-manno-octulosonic-acid transferase
VVRFFARVKPLAIILAELEIWPMMLLWAQVCRVPVIVLNARMSAKSRRGWGRTGPFGRLIFGGLRGALAQNHQWAARLSELGTPNVEVTGSLKADAVSEPSPEKIAACAEQFNLTRPGDADHQPTLLIASTAALADSNGGEEDIALRSWQQWGPDAGWHLIIAPRHPERGDDVAQEVRNVLGQETLIWQASRDQSPPPANAVRIIDQIGVLIALYALADLAIIGGGWGSGRGSQNMLEAAAAKCPAIVGPDYKNFPDIIPLLVEADALIQLDDPQDLDATLRTLAADPTRRQAIGERSYTTWQNNRGSVRRVAEVLPALFHEK